MYLLKIGTFSKQIFLNKTIFQKSEHFGCFRYLYTFQLGDIICFFYINFFLETHHFGGQCEQFSVHRYFWFIAILVHRNFQFTIILFRRYFWFTGLFGSLPFLGSLVFLVHRHFRITIIFGHRYFRFTDIFGSPAFWVHYYFWSTTFSVH